MKPVFCLENQFDKHNIARCECFEDRIVLTTIRDGGLSDFYASKVRTIFFNDISSVVISEGPKSFWSADSSIAYLQFHTKGSPEASVESLCAEKNHKGYRKLIDNGAMIFMRKNQEEQICIAKQIRDYIDMYHQSSQRSEMKMPQHTLANDIYSELIRFKELLDAGVITESEFQALKHKLIHM